MTPERRSPWAPRRLAAYALMAIAGVGGCFALKTRPVEARAVPVERGAVVREAVGTGTIESDAQVTLAFTIPGRVAEVGAREGDVVRTGDVVASLDAGEHELELTLARRSVEVAAAAVQRSAADIERARVVLDAASREQRRAELLFEAGSLSAADLDAARERAARAQADLAAAHAGRRQSGGSAAVARDAVKLRARRAEDAVLRSPVDGVVVRRVREPGDVVAPGAPVLVVASTKKVWARAWMDETVLHELREGQAARVVLRGDPARPLAGRVDRVAVEADRQTHELLVDVELVERPERLVFGQRADAFVTLERRDDATRVPRDACSIAAGRCFVDRGGRVARADVRFGVLASDWAEVTEGLSPGDVLLVPPDAAAELGVGRRVRRANP